MNIKITKVNSRIMSGQEEPQEKASQNIRMVTKSRSGKIDLNQDNESLDQNGEKDRFDFLRYLIIDNEKY